MSHDTIFVGLDYHQMSIQVCVLDARGEVLLNRACENSSMAIKEIIDCFSAADVQWAMMANGMREINGAKAMFDEAKNAYGGPGEDHDMIDHLDPSSSFGMDIGGQG